MTRRFQRLCVFCGGNNLSKEHIYSHWISTLLPYHGTHYYAEEQHTFIKKTERLPLERKRRPGHLFTKKIKAVCKKCNSGWMNRNEGAAKPILSRLIKGETLELNPASQEAVARWIAMKAIVAEYATRDLTVTPLSDRVAMMSDGTIPPYFNIYAARHDTSYTSGFERHSCTFSRSASGPIPPLDGMRKNIQQITMVIGALVLHLNAARLAGFKIEDHINPALYAGIRIWPIEREVFEWSTSRRLSPHDFSKLATSLEILTAHPSVAWAPDLRQ